VKLQSVVLTAVVAVTGCAESADVASTSQQVEMPCVALDGFGAVASDGLDDQAAIQAALDSSPGCLQLSAGRYDVARLQGIGTDYRVTLRIDRPVVLRGAGQDLTTLAMMGSGIKDGTTVPADWVLIGIINGAENVTIEDMTIDGANRWDTNEQTHLVEVSGRSKTTVLQRLTMNLPVIPGVGGSGGDCIRLTGRFDARVYNVTVRDVLATECDRSWMSIQKGVHNVFIYDSTTLRVGDQAIDFEPTGHDQFCANDSEPVITNVRMHHLQLFRGELGRGANTVALAGAAACAPASGIWFTDNTVGQGGFWLHNLQRSYIQRVTVEE
jgi:hypothetical protein